MVHRNTHTTNTHNEFGKIPDKTPTNKQSEVYTIAITGNKITRNWWGMAWQNKILSYSDYANRLPRARSYVRTGKVQELTVMPNCVTAKVKGSHEHSYNVTIAIDPLSKEAKSQLISLFTEHILSLIHI